MDLALERRDGKWTITSLPAIPASIAPRVDDLAQVPGTGQVWAPVFYEATSGAPRDAILHYTP